MWLLKVLLVYKLEWFVRFKRLTYTLEKKILVFCLKMVIATLKRPWRYLLKMILSTSMHPMVCHSNGMAFPMSFESFLFQSSQLFMSFSKDTQEKHTFWPYLSVLWTVFFSVLHNHCWPREEWIDKACHELSIFSCSM